MNGVFLDTTTLSSTQSGESATWSYLTDNLADGTYSFKAQVYDAAGRTTVTQPYEVTVRTNVAPVVTAAADQTADEGAATTFSLGSFSDPGDDDPWKVTVDWGDLSSDTFDASAAGSLGSLSHTYADDGTYTVTVTVQEDDGTGASDADTFDVVVANVAPVVTAADNQTANEGASTTFALGSFSDPGDDDPWEVTVDWGDLSSDTFDASAAGSLGSLSHTYADDGTYTVTVTVQEDDGTGASDAATFDVVVANVAPVVTAADNQTANEGASTTFALGSFSDPGDDDPWQVTVDWGDLSSDTFDASAAGSLGSLSHTYADDGTYTVTVTVQEDDGTGASDADTFDVVVANVAPVVTAADNQTANEGASTTFALGSFSDPGDDDPWEVTVDWGDLSSDTFDASAAGSLGSLSHTYADDGTYTVTVTVQEDDGTGASDADTFDVVVANVDAGRHRSRQPDGERGSIDDIRSRVIQRSRR